MGGRQVIFLSNLTLFFGPWLNLWRHELRSRPLLVEVQARRGPMWLCESKPLGTKLKFNIFEFTAFIDTSDQNQLYHTPLLSKIWDLSDRKKLVNNPFNINLTSHSFNVFILKQKQKLLQHNQYATHRTHTHLTKQTKKQMQQKNKCNKQTNAVGGPRCFFVPWPYRNPVPGTYFHGHKN